MKATRIITYNLVFLILALFLTGTQSFAAKKAKLRITVQYINELDQGAYVELITKAKGEDGTQPVPLVMIKYYVFNDDTTIHLGDVSTNEEGIVQIPIDLKKLQIDTSGLVSLRFSAKGNEDYKSAKKALEIRDCIFNAELDKSEEGYTLSIKLLDEHTGASANGEPVFLGVSRLFNALPIGDGTYYTDKDGMVFVSFQDSIPSVDGNLEFIAKLNESEMYGTIIKRIVKPYGYIAKRDNMFEERTMWSPPNKTPYVLLIFPNLIILGVWAIIIMQLLNLIKIRKLKKQ